MPKKRVVSGGNGWMQPDPSSCWSTVAKAKPQTHTGLQGGTEQPPSISTSRTAVLQDSSESRSRGPCRGRIKGGQEMLLFPTLEQILPRVFSEAPEEGKGGMQRGVKGRKQMSRNRDTTCGFQLLQEERRK